MGVAVQGNRGMGKKKNREAKDKKNLVTKVSSFVQDDKCTSLPVAQER